MKKLLVFCLVFLASSVAVANDACKVLLTQNALQLEGGYRIPSITYNGKIYKSRYMDNLPGSNRWVGEHRGSTAQMVVGIIEFTEPGAIGTGADPETWPELTYVQTLPALTTISDDISPWAMHWIDSDTVYASSRKGYRSGFEAQWISKVTLSTGAETIYSVREVPDSEPNADTINMNMMQAFGAGFVRLHDTSWANTYAGGRNFLLGRGGYDTLESPLGPALAVWDEGDAFITNNETVLLFDQQNPIARDGDYLYPSLDPDTGSTSSLAMWQNPTDIDNGFFQGGNIGYLTQIYHPYIKGFVATHNFNRGTLDYRAQGSNTGKGVHFAVADTQLFYTTDGAGNRGGHSEEPLNAGHPNAVAAWGAHVFDPADIGASALGNIQKHEPQAERFDWPWGTFPVQNYVDAAQQNTGLLNITQMGSLTWDNERQRLWITTYNPAGFAKPAYLLQYSLIDTRPDLITGITVAISN